MKTLLDTCTLAEIQKPTGLEAVKQAVAAIPEEDLFLSVITYGEIVKGVALLQDGRRKRELSQWLEDLVAHYERRILPVDRETAVTWGELSARAQLAGVQVPPADGLIAATALRHGLRVMTRNTRDFQATGVLVIDPWA